MLFKQVLIVLNVLGVSVATITKPFFEVKSDRFNVESDRFKFVYLYFFSIILKYNLKILN